MVWLLTAAAQQRFVFIMWLREALKWFSVLPCSRENTPCLLLEEMFLRTGLFSPWLCVALPGKAIGPVLMPCPAASKLYKVFFSTNLEQAACDFVQKH